jgi:hypothetical protein
MPIYEHPDDLPPQFHDISEQLRQRAEEMGCECRPAAHQDDLRRMFVLEHSPPQVGTL